MSNVKLPEENCKIDTSQIEKKLSQIDPSIFEGVKEQKKQQIIKGMVLTMSKTHIGPIPDPETLKAYSEIIPNGAERIMIMAEQQASHRMYLEKKVVGGQMNQSNIGQFLAFFIGIAALLTAAYCIVNGHEIGGSIIGLSGITGLVTAFIQGKKSQNKNLQEKSNKIPKR